MAAPRNQEALEYSVKAAFLFKFGGYVEWPPGTFSTSNTPFVIAILGDDPFGNYLDQIAAGHRIDDRPVMLSRIRTIDQAQGVQVLFISQSEKEKIGSIANYLQNKNILTVADFEQSGIILTFIIDNNKVRFNVNLEEVERNGLKLSSKLLSVANNIKSR